MSDNQELKNLLVEIGLTLDSSKIDQLNSYIDYLYEWNEKINLTAIPKEKALLLHIVDSLSLVKVVDFGSTRKVIDIGTGAGFPGVPIKIAFPKVNLTLVDSTRKKLKFIEGTLQTIGLNAEIIHARAEELNKQNKFKEHYDLVVARAVADLAKLLEMLFPFVSKDGLIVAMKGPEIEDELSSAKSSLGKLGIDKITVERFILPHSEIGRSLVIVRR